MKYKAILLAMIAGLSVVPAMAETAGSWTLGIGAGYVDPDSDNGSLAGNTLDVDVDSNVRPTITGEYFFQDNIGVEVLAAVPFQHDITLTNTTTGATIDAETKHLPPTVSVQYHFDTLHSSLKPFLGLGLNYTNFFDEEIDLTGNDLDIQDSWGIAGHAGVDYNIAPNKAVRLDLRYINIEPDVELNGSDIGTVEINPMVYGISYIQRF